MAAKKKAKPKKARRQRIHPGKAARALAPGRRV